MEKQQPIGIIGAMSMEIEAILKAAEILSVEEHANMRFYEASLSGTPCVVVQCSTGKVNSAVCAQVMIDRYRPRAILNIGVAGGIGADVRIGDVVVGSTCVQYDFDVSAVGVPVGQLCIPPNDREITEFPCDRELSRKLLDAAKELYGSAHLGVIATGDRFVADPEAGEMLQKQFGALACEMEGGSIAHACLINGVPCAVLRAISDNARDTGHVDFDTFAMESAHKAQQLLCSVIGTL